MKVDELLEDLSDLLEDSKELPVVNKVMVDKTQINNILDEIRANLPTETRQAKRVVAERNKIIEEARKQAETLISAANSQRAGMLEDSEIVKQARIEAKRIIDEAQEEAIMVRNRMNTYVDTVLQRTEDLLVNSAKMFHEEHRRIIDAKNAPKRPQRVEQPAAEPMPQEEIQDEPADTVSDIPHTTEETQSEA